MMRIALFCLSLLVAVPAIAQDMPATAPTPKAVAAAPADVCAQLKADVAKMQYPTLEQKTKIEEGEKLCAAGKYAEGALKLREVLGK